MKSSIMICLSILLLFISYSKQEEACSKVTCSDIYNPDTCSLPLLGKTKFQSCAPNKFCSFNIDDDTTPAQCKDSLEDKTPKYPGMSCKVDSDCVKNKCVSGKCQEIQKGQKCSTSFECAYGLTCINEECVTPKSEGSSCKVDYDCEITSGCLDGVCTKYFSLEDGKQTGYVNVHEKGLSFCASGFASEFGECQTLYLKNGVEPCDQNNPCKYSYVDEEIIEPTNCLCGFNPTGERHCKLGSGDEKYKNYVKLLKDYYFNHADNCHITERGEGPCSKDILSTDATIKERVKNLEISKLEALYNTQLYNSESCIKPLIYPNLYEDDSVKTCATYSCSTETTVNCAKSNYSTDKLSITLFNSCKDNEYCDIQGEPNKFFYEKKDKVSICSAKSSMYLKYPGESCDNNLQCKVASKNNQAFGHCVSGKCFGYEKGEKCESTIECNAGNYCENNICVEQKSKGAECKKTEECKNNLLCYQGKCEDKIYSFDKGTDVSGLENPELYCKLGLVFNNKCVEVIEKESSFKECKIGEECLYETNNKESFKRNCQCGYNQDGKGYCPRMHSYNGSKWNKLFSLKKESYNNKCHSLNRYTCETSKDKEIKEIEFDTAYAHLYYKSVDCAKTILGGLPNFEVDASDL